MLSSGILWNIPQVLQAILFHATENKSDQHVNEVHTCEKVKCNTVNNKTAFLFFD